MGPFEEKNRDREKKSEEITATYMEK